MTDLKNTFFNGNPDYFKEKLESFVDQFGMNFEDVKDLSVAALIGKLLMSANDDESRSELNRIMNFVRGSGLAEKTVKAIGIGEMEKTKNS